MIVPAALDVGATQRRTLRVLCAGQVLGGLGVGSGIAVSGLLAERVAGTDAVAGLAQTASVIGAALLAVPVSRLISDSGRRPGLASAYALAVVGAGTTALGAALGSLALVLGGMFLFGAGTTATLQTRYAGTDLAAPARRGSALSLVVWSTALGAVLGPNIIAPAGRLAVSAGVPALAGPFLFSALLFGLAALLLTVLLRPDPLVLARRLSLSEPGLSGLSEPGLSRAAHSPARTTVRQSLDAVLSTADGRLGLLAVVASHSVMVSVMVLTPVHLGHGGAALTVIGLVISVHVAGMYALSPVVGWVADRVGRRRAIAIGSVVLLVALLVTGSASEHNATQLAVGLFLLGTGWSFGLIAGSTLVTESVPIDVRAGVQGTTDLVMGLAAGLAGALAGPVVATAGYAALNAVAAVIVVPLLVLAVHEIRAARLRA